MKKSLITVGLILLFTALAVFVSLCFVPDTTVRRTAEILSVSASGETLTAVEAPAQSEKSGIIQTEVYQASLDRQGVAYCLVYRIDAGAEGSFEIAVGLDMSDNRVLGVCLLSDGLTVTDGSYVSWAKSGYLDVYKDLARKQLDTVEPLASAPCSTRKIADAVTMAFETIDVRKESEDAYE